MKKILLTLCVLLGTVGAWAQVSSITDGGTYNISFKKNGWFFSSTLKTTQSNPGSFRFDEVETGVYNIYSVEEEKYITRADEVANGNSPTLSETLEDTDNFKWVAVYDSEASDWRIKTLDEAFCLNGWTNSLSESNDVKFFNNATHDLAPLILTVAPSAEQKAAYNILHGWINTIQSAKGLVTDATNYTSNAKSSAEGTYEALLDNEYSTYFHGAYGSEGPDEDQYLQATLSAPVDAFYFYYKKRHNNNNNRPTSITIYGSNDGTEFTEIKTINSGLPTDATVLDYVSSKIALGTSYKYIRFVVTSTNNGATNTSGHVFFTFSEFYLLPSDVAIDNAMSLYSSLAGKAANDYTAQQITDITDANTALTSNIIKVTYNLYESDGVTLVEAKTIDQEKNSEAVNPFTISNYYDYAVTGTIGSADCEISVTRTLKASIVHPITNLSNNKAYTLTTVRGALGTDGTQMVSSFGTSHTASNFAIISYEDNYYLYSVADSKFVGNPVTINSVANQPALTDDLSNVTPVNFTLTTAPYYFMGMGSNGVNVSSYATGIVVNSWTTRDDGNQYVIQEAADFDPTAALAVLNEYYHPSYTVTYVVKDAGNNVLFTSAPVGTTKDAKITTLPEEFQMAGFYTYNEVDVTISAVGNTNVEFTATPKAEPLVQYTADTSSPYYYNLNIRSKYLVYNSEATGEVTLQDNSEPFNADASWAFIGEPYAGFKVINQTKGASNFLTYTSVVTGGNGGADGSNNNIQFVAAEDFTNQYWLIDKNSNGIVLRMKENPAIYFHHQNITGSSGYLRTCSVTEWGSVHNDPGSTIEAVSDEDVLLALYDALSSNNYGTTIGSYYSTDEEMTVSAIKDILSEVAEVVENENTSQYGSAYEKLLNVSENLAIVAPEPGFYRVRNVATEGYLTATAVTGYTSEEDAVMANGTIDSPATIIELREIDGQLYLMNQGAFFNWVVSDKSAGSGKAWVRTDTYDKYVNWMPGTASGQIAFAICYGNGAGSNASYLKKGIYTANENQAVVGGDDYTVDAAQWIFEEVTDVEIPLVNLDGTGYATTYLPFPVSQIDGAKPYLVSVENGWAVLKEIDGDQIPAGTPVVLVGEDSETALCTIGEAEGANITEEDVNVLSGIYFAQPVEGYVLSFNDEEVVGFYLLESEAALGANHAYIPYATVHPEDQNGEEVKGFALSLGLQNAIEKLVAEQADGTVYNLAGQRVQKAVKGIFIKNGKKLVK